MDEHKNRRFGMFGVVLSLILGVVAYPLSAGPILWLYVHCGEPREILPAIMVFVWPLNWIMERNELLHTVIGWYVNLWVP